MMDTLLASVPFMPVLPLLLLPLLAIITYHFIIYPVLLSPASRIPSAHWSATILPLWILHKRFWKCQNAALQEAHRRLGPYVRVAPGEVSVDDIDGVRTVYAGGFDKPVWYGFFENYGVPNMFSSRRSKEHSLRKRMISNVYSKSYIQSSPAMTAQARILLYDRFFPALERSSSERGIDVYSLFHATAMDFITAYIWGISRSTNFIDNQSNREHWLKMNSARNSARFFPQELPRLTALCRTIGFPLYPSWVSAANQENAAGNVDMWRRTMEDIETGKDVAKDTADEPVVTNALLNGIRKEEDTRGETSPLYTTTLRHKDLSTQSELWDHTLAGQETTRLALTYLTWHMSQHLDVQSQLREELLGLGGPNLVKLGDARRSVPDPKKLDALPLLHAIIMETLRLNSPLPGPQPREVPRTGARVGPYEVPGGVRIAALAYTLHRDERVFPEAEKWNPYRWLDDDEERKKKMGRQFWAFGSGGRMCIGSNFAMLEIKLIVAAMYSNYTTHIVDDTGIEQGDGYTGLPAGEHIWLRFEPVV
ncbi:Tryprostatin B 6-hydroxylase [Cytospora mali]|uniref:Tryprostatin B 6-hydroxylase n=1 Tax=Cytospora mali TaxID=578113 RepID=A0A194W0R2_CYTMA|nr:Tryprostatin B 6-hydroxylase [Valsa mali]